jgi:effector-binding domain-containing protein
MLKNLKSVGLSLILSGCVALPKPPNTPLCSFDNASQEDESFKKPNFKCLSANNTRFQVYWNSPSADKMICTPYKDYVELQAYYKKLFEIFEKEYLNKKWVKK